MADEQLAQNRTFQRASISKPGKTTLSNTSPLSMVLKKQETINNGREGPEFSQT